MLLWTCASSAALLLSCVVALQPRCNPLINDCPEDPAVGGTYTQNFREQPEDWIIESDNSPLFNGSGLNMVLSQERDGLALRSKRYIMFGHLTAMVKHTPAVGVIARMGLASDPNDNIQFIWASGMIGKVQTAYYGLNHCAQDCVIVVIDEQTGFNKYEFDWTPDRILWMINGNVVRKVVPAQALNGSSFPQTPMSLFFETMDGVYWNQGGGDWTKGPYSMYVQSAEMIDYSTGSSYRYTDRTATLASIESVGGSINRTTNANIVSSSSKSATGTSTSTIGTSGTTNAANSGISPGSASPTLQSAASGLSVAAQAGIGVVVGLVGLGILGFIVLAWRRRNKKGRNWAEKRADDPGLAIGEPGVAVEVGQWPGIDSRTRHEKGK